MRKNWRQISVDEDRQITTLENYDQFQELLSSVCIPEPIKDFFPRPDQSTPITSYGVICVHESRSQVTPDADAIASGHELVMDTLEYYCCQRRTTIEFGEIVKCGPRQKNLFEYLSCLTSRERELLTSVPHERLWKDILLQETPLFTESYKSTSSIFECYEGVLEKLIDLTESNIDQPPWEFPKGRKGHNERTLLQAALREMSEEGKVNFQEVILLWDDVVNDVYRGTDGQLYETVYFVIKAEQRYEPPITHLDTNVIGEYCLSIDMADYTWIKLPKVGKLEKGSTPLCDRLERMLFKLHRKLI